jgi:hypothetical protein
MLFSPEEVSRIRLVLGYEEFPKYEQDIKIALEKIQDEIRYDRVISLVDTIDEIDEKIQQYVEKLYVVEVEGIKLQYQSIIDGLKREGTRRLKELAHQTALDVRYNPFKGGGQGFSFVSFP